MRPWRPAIIAFFFSAALAAGVPLPPRDPAAPSGSALARQLLELTLADRESEILRQIERGNVPAFWRQFSPVTVRALIDGRERALKFFAAPDYVAVGGDDDFFLAPLSPSTAQALADHLDCLLPTPRMVDAIFVAATEQLEPTPIPPSPAMTRMSVFAEHNERIRLQRLRMRGEKEALNPALAAGHKKDVVITPRLAGAPGKVAIYGWHQPGGKPIQPLYLGHTEAWVDYSHGIRLVQNAALLDGQPTTLAGILADPALASLLSDEGPIPNPRYPARRPAANHFGERSAELYFEPGVRIHLNSPAATDSTKPTRLVLYALPNGNSIEETIGHRPRPGDSPRVDIQHIGAQTRWLRRKLSDANLIIAYLECSGQSWPAWRRKNDPDHSRVAGMVDQLRQRFASPSLKIVLTGHSGGGSFTFGYLNAAADLPADIERIAFLDSNYGYDRGQGHAEKLARWLVHPSAPFLCVLAYHDSVALLNGQTFVSAAGGTWGRSRAMIEDLQSEIDFGSREDDHWERHFALGGRVQFFLKKNPEKAILHTVQVERNGFIHALLSGTPLENDGYVYFGPRAYDELVAPE